MTKTLEQEAREAAEGFADSVDAETGRTICKGSYMNGYIAAATALDKEIEELRARVKELEGMVPRPCQECGGHGMIESVGMEHGSGCTDSRCCSDCPVAVQVVEPCGACGGYGALMVPPIPLPDNVNNKEHND